jgi:hypothetical protein
MLDAVSTFAASALAFGHVGSRGVDRSGKLTLDTATLFAAVAVGAVGGLLTFENCQQRYEPALVALGVVAATFADRLSASSGSIGAFDVESSPRRSRVDSIAAALTPLVVGVATGMQVERPDVKRIDDARSFYGVLKVKEYPSEEKESAVSRILSNGDIMHGSETISPDGTREPTTYYGRRSGVGRLLDRPRSGPISVGMIGMGAGTQAFYGRKGDLFRFFEIDAEVERLARKHFSFIAKCEATVDVVIGDGRVSLSRDRTDYDVIILDAFAGDAIPAHLLTVEAIEIYLARLKPSGVLAIHITNRHLDLSPILNDHAARWNLKLDYYLPPEGAETFSMWALLCREALPIEPLRPASIDRTRRLSWTDGHHSLLSVMIPFDPPEWIKQRWPWTKPTKPARD